MESMMPAYRRFSGMTLLAAGSCIVFGSLFRPDQTLPGWTVGTICNCVYGTLSLGFLIAIFGLIALFFTLGRNMGVITKIALLLATALSAFISGTLFILFGYIIPILQGSSVYTPLLSVSGPIMGGMPMIALTGSIILYSVSIFIIGIHLIRRGWILPGMLLLAAPLMAFTPPLPYLIGMLGGVLLGLGHIVIGYRLWKWAPPSENGALPA
jgi:hypothetical protein